MTAQYFIMEIYDQFLIVSYLGGPQWLKSVHSVLVNVCIPLMMLCVRMSVEMEWCQ